MKYDFRDLPEKTVRKEENAYFFAYLKSISNLLY